jgi:hypothetical protein
LGFLIRGLTAISSHIPSFLSCRSSGFICRFVPALIPSARQRICTTLCNIITVIVAFFTCIPVSPRSASPYFLPHGAFNRILSRVIVDPTFFRAIRRVLFQSFTQYDNSRIVFETTKGQSCQRLP